jgi:hypothetical protein
MSRYFAIGIENADEDQKNALRAWFEDEDEGEGTWWNWIPGFWMFVTKDDEMAANEIRDKVREITKSNVIVLQVTPVTWSGYGPNAEKRNMFTWIRENWRIQED